VVFPEVVLWLVILALAEASNQATSAMLLAALAIELYETLQFTDLSLVAMDQEWMVAPIK